MNMKELLTGHNARLRNVIRFSNCTRHHDESVAEHTYFVLLYCLLIGMELDLSRQRIAWLLECAVVHDLEEAVSGDIVHSFKYSDERITKAIKENAPASFHTVIDNLRLKDRHHMKLAEAFNMGKAGKDGDILRLADVLSTIGYVCREIQAGNNSIKSECLGLREFLGTMRNFPRLDPYIDGTLEMMKEVGL